MQKHIELWDVCRKFIDENKLETNDDVYNLDSGDAINLIEQICEIMGYYEDWKDGSE